MGIQPGPKPGPLINYRQSLAVIGPGGPGFSCNRVPRDEDAAVPGAGAAASVQTRSRVTVR